MGTYCNIQKQCSENKTCETIFLILFHDEFFDIEINFEEFRIIFSRNNYC